MVLGERAVVRVVATVGGTEGEGQGRVNDRNLERRWLWPIGKPLRFYRAKDRRLHSKMENVQAAPTI